MVTGWFSDVFRSPTAVDVGLGLVQTDYRECIGQDIEHGCGDKDGMLWVGCGHRLGVDLCAKLQCRKIVGNV